MDLFRYLLLLFVCANTSRCLFVATLRSPVGEESPLSSLECDDVLCFCHFPIRCPGSGVLLDCINS